MAPVLFNLFMCERWKVRAHEVDEVGGVRLLYKYDGKLFRRYTCVRECQFADDSGLLSGVVQNPRLDPIRWWAQGLA